MTAGGGPMDGYLREYEDIRAEIRQHFEWRAHAIHFAILLTTAVIGTADLLRAPLLFLGTALIILFIWYDVGRHLSAVFRAATYLELFVEPYVPGLKWETAGGLHSVQTPKRLLERVVANGLFPTMYACHVYLMYLYSDWPGRVRGIVVAFLAVLFLLMGYWSVRVVGSREGSMAEWKNIEGGLNAKEARKLLEAPETEARP